MNTPAECPVQYDVMSIRTNYITAYLYTGLIDYGESLCSPAGRPTQIDGTKLYNTLPNDIRSLLVAPVVVTVVVTLAIGFVVGGGVMCIICRCRRSKDSKFKPISQS